MLRDNEKTKWQTKNRNGIRFGENELADCSSTREEKNRALKHVFAIIGK